MMQIQNASKGMFTHGKQHKDVVKKTYKSVLKFVKILYQYQLQQVRIGDNEKRRLAKIQSAVEDNRGEKQVCTVHKLHNISRPGACTLLHSYIRTYILCLGVYICL